eukprot:347837-Prorocentrum_minimum.AAC.1
MYLIIELRTLRQVNSFVQVRGELLRLGLGPFNNWRQMTSGAHGVFMAASLCQSVSMNCTQAQSLTSV